MGIVLHRTDEVVCRICKAQMQPHEHFCGSRMWHHMQPTCRHEEFFICPTCYAPPAPPGSEAERVTWHERVWDTPERKCSVCANSCFYT